MKHIKKTKNHCKTDSINTEEETLNPIQIDQKQMNQRRNKPRMIFYTNPEEEITDFQKNLNKSKIFEGARGI